MVELLNCSIRTSDSGISFWIVSDATGKDFGMVRLLPIFCRLGEDLGQIPQAGCFLDDVLFIPAVDNTSAYADICLEV